MDQHRLKFSLLTCASGNRMMQRHTYVRSTLIRSVPHSIGRITAHHDLDPAVCTATAKTPRNQIVVGEINLLRQSALKPPRNETHVQSGPRALGSYQRSQLLANIWHCGLVWTTFCRLYVSAPSHGTAWHQPDSVDATTPSATRKSTDSTDFEARHMRTRSIRIRRTLQHKSLPLTPIISRVLLQHTDSRLLSRVVYYRRQPAPGPSVSVQLYSDTGMHQTRGKTCTRS